MSANHDTDALWRPLVEHGSQWCASNVRATAQWLEVRGARWRIAVTQPVSHNSYVVSATGQYLYYAREEIRRLPSSLSRSTARAALLPMAPILRRIDPVVMLDALPLSTVLHQTRSREQWEHALQATRNAYPGVPILVRSLDHVVSRDTLALLTDVGCCKLPSRLVFHQDPRRNDFWRVRNVRNDVALAHHQPLQARTLVVDDSARIAELYWQLYGEKHSQLNPQYSPEWLAHGIRAGVLRGEGLMHDGRLVAAYLSYSVESVMTNPVFGYDTALPQQLGLYRRLSLLTMQAAKRDNVRLHASSGAPGFKASRGGVATMEYHAVDLTQVRGAQRAAWAVLLRVANAIAPAILRVAQ
jgi:hypothetical protein